MTESDPAADVDLQERLLRAARRQASPTRTDKIVVGGDRARVVKTIVKKWGLTRGDYIPDSPTNDELINLCIATPELRHGYWMLYMSRSRAGLDLAHLIKKPTSAGGLPSKQIQVIENDLNGPAWDAYRGLGVEREQVGLVLRLGERGLFVYSMLKIIPPRSGSVTFCLGDPHNEEDWRAIFPLEGLTGPEEE